MIRTSISELKIQKVGIDIYVGINNSRRKWQENPKSHARLSIQLHSLKFLF